MQDATHSANLHAPVTLPEFKKNQIEKLILNKRLSELARFTNQQIYKSPSVRLGLQQKVSMWMSRGQRILKYLFTLGSRSRGVSDSKSEIALFEAMFLNTPPWSSDRDPQRRFPRLQTFRPFESPDVFGGRAASGDQPDVPVGLLSFGTQRLPPAMRGSLWPFHVDRIHPSCLQRSWKLSVAFSHRVLNRCKLGLIISLQRQLDLEIFGTRPRAFTRPRFGPQSIVSVHSTRPYRASLGQCFGPVVRWIIYTGGRRLSPAFVKWLKISSGSSCARSRMMPLLRPQTSLS